MSGAANRQLHRIAESTRSRRSSQIVDVEEQPYEKASKDSKKPFMFSKFLNAAISWCKSRASGLPVWIIFTMVWIIWILICEKMAVSYYISRCEWPDDGKNPASHILAFADSQMHDLSSYPHLPGPIVPLVEFYSDLYMKRSWSLAFKRHKPTGVFILGDIMDGGRQMNDISSSLRRFKTVFQSHEEVPIFSVAGNHDVGIQQWLRPELLKRWRQSFGALNFKVNLGGIEVAGFCAPCIADIESQIDLKKSFDLMQFQPSFNHTMKKVRAGRDETSAEAKRKTLAFLHGIAMSRTQDTPLLLLSHVPFYRSHGEKCAPKNIQKNDITVTSRIMTQPVIPGAGVSYMNTLPKELTESILRALNPQFILTGDHHRFCPYFHPSGALEVTLPTPNFLMGEFFPAISLLSLSSSHFGVYICDTVPQWSIYISYLTLFIISTLILLFAVLKRRKKWDLESGVSARAMGRGREGFCSSYTKGVSASILFYIIVLIYDSFLI